MDKLDLILQKLEGMEKDINGVKGDIKGIKGDIDGIKGDIDGIKGEIDGINGKIDAINGEINTIKTEQQRHSDLLHQLIKTVSATNAKVETLEEKVDQGFERIETDIKILIDESLNQKREIYRLKKS